MSGGRDVVLYAGNVLYVVHSSDTPTGIHDSFGERYVNG